jgi:hypothetical protein
LGVVRAAESDGVAHGLGHFFFLLPKDGRWPM